MVNKVNSNLYSLIRRLRLSLYHVNQNYFFITLIFHLSNYKYIFKFISNTKYKEIRTLRFESHVQKGNFLFKDVIEEPIFYLTTR